MKIQRQEQCPFRFESIYASRLWAAVLPLFLSMLSISAHAQEEGQEPPLPAAQATSAVQEPIPAPITAAIGGVTTPQVGELAKALHIGEGLEGSGPGASPNVLQTLGDMDGDGVPEMLLKWAVPDSNLGVGIVPASDSPPVWGVYLLSWDGAHWKVSRLASGVEKFTTHLVNLGAPVGQGLALVIHEGDSGIAYPAIFQVKDHAATLLWDAQSDDSRYEPLLQAQVVFQDHANAPTEMMVTGRADPGFFRVEPKGQRGFRTHAVYHWDGKAFIPAKTEYIADEDYTIYRFIAALHLHDFRSAYGLVVPAEFLKADSPTLEAFRQFVQDNWPEFLQDGVFLAPELSAAAPDAHLFTLSKPDHRYVYHPIFSKDGKFLLTGLTRTREELPAEP
jgi:hypothetical protein